MFKAAGATALLSFILALVAVIMFSGGCGCPDAQLWANDAEALTAAREACGILKDDGTTGSTPENNWCAVMPAEEIKYDEDSDAGQTCSGEDGCKQVKTRGTGTAFILCIVGFVFELLNVIVCFVLVKPGGNKVGP